MDNPFTPPTDKPSPESEPTIMSNQIPNPSPVWEPEPAKSEPAPVWTPEPPAAAPQPEPVIPPVTPIPPAAPPAKSNKKTWIIVAIVVVVLLCCCCLLPLILLGIGINNGDIDLDQLNRFLGMLLPLVI